MQFTEQQPPSAAVPPPAAAPAAGIASTSREAHFLMPAAPFPEACSLEAKRQHAIGPRQCRWILADEDAGANALMCGATTEPRRPFCAAHCARVYEKPLEEEGAEDEAAESEEKNEDHGPEEEQEEAVDERIDDGIKG